MKEMKKRRELWLTTQTWSLNHGTEGNALTLSLGSQGSIIIPLNSMEKSEPHLITTKLEISLSIYLWTTISLYISNSSLHNCWEGHGKKVVSMFMSLLHTHCLVLTDVGSVQSCSTEEAMGRDRSTTFPHSICSNSKQLFPNQDS